jgi:diguanylate cyclase (GGDEF)-like protein
LKPMIMDNHQFPHINLDCNQHMKTKITLAYTGIGGLAGFFIFHPLVMLIGRIMSEKHTLYEYNINQLIISEALKSLSPEMLPWSLSFSIGGFLAGYFYGKSRYIQKKFEYLSYNDCLTGIPNRRYFNENLEHEWRNGVRFAKPISLIMCDIDFFKSYNDEYGHQKGDECLQMIAQSINHSLKRPRDIATRYGGEEFAVLLPETDKKGASLVAEAIYNSVRSLGISHHQSSISDFVTISLGVVTIMPAEWASKNDLITMADQALYLAKLEGRDRIKDLGRNQTLSAQKFSTPVEEIDADANLFRI